MEGGETLTSDLFCYLEDIEIYILCMKRPSSAKIESCQAQCPGLFQVMLLYLLLSLLFVFTSRELICWGLSSWIL